MRGRGLTSRGYGPVLLGALVFVAFCVSWRTLVQPHLPEMLRPDIWRGEFVWLQGGSGALYSSEDLDEAELLFVGDSRIHDAIIRPEFERFGDVAVLWGGGGQLLELLPAARNYPARRLVVGITPIAVHAIMNELVSAILAEERPVIEPLQAEEQLDAWEARERERLIALGHPQQVVEAQLETWTQILRQDALFQRWDPRGIDARLSEWAERRRGRYLRPITAKPWARRWFGPHGNEASIPFLTTNLREDTRTERAAALEEIVRLLAGLREDGWEVACVRFPLAKELFAVEDEALAAEALADMCARAGVPYFDYALADYTWRDGSHLAESGARAFSKRFARELGERMGWKAP